MIRLKERNERKSTYLVWDFIHRNMNPKLLELTWLFLYCSPGIITCGFQTITGSVTNVVL